MASSGETIASTSAFATDTAGPYGKGVIPVQGDHWYCTLCHVHMMNEDSVKSHIETPKHLEQQVLCTEATSAWEHLQAENLVDAFEQGAPHQKYRDGIGCFVDLQLQNHRAEGPKSSTLSSPRST